MRAYFKWILIISATIILLGYIIIASENLIWSEDNFVWLKNQFKVPFRIYLDLKSSWPLLMYILEVFFFINFFWYLYMKIIPFYIQNTIKNWISLKWIGRIVLIISFFCFSKLCYLFIVIYLKGNSWSDWSLELLIKTFKEEHLWSDTWIYEEILVNYIVFLNINSLFLIVTLLYKNNIFYEEAWFIFKFIIGSFITLVLFLWITIIWQVMKDNSNLGESMEYGIIEALDSYKDTLYMLYVMDFNNINMYVRVIFLFWPFFWLSCIVNRYYWIIIWRCCVFFIFYGLVLTAWDIKIPSVIWVEIVTVILDCKIKIEIPSWNHEEFLKDFFFLIKNHIFLISREVMTYFIPSFDYFFLKSNFLEGQILQYIIYTSPWWLGSYLLIFPLKNESTVLNLSFTSFLLSSWYYFFNNICPNYVTNIYLCYIAYIYLRLYISDESIVVWPEDKYKVYVSRESFGKIKQCEVPLFKNFFTIPNINDCKKLDPSCEHMLGGVSNMITCLYFEPLPKEIKRSRYVWVPPYVQFSMGRYSHDLNFRNFVFKILPEGRYVSIPEHSFSVLIIMHKPLNWWWKDGIIFTNLYRFILKFRGAAYGLSKEYCLTTYYIPKFLENLMLTTFFRSYLHFSINSWMDWPYGIYGGLFYITDVFILFWGIICFYEIFKNFFTLVKI